MRALCPKEGRIGLIVFILDSLQIACNGTLSVNVQMHTCVSVASLKLLVGVPQAYAPQTS